MNVEVRKHREAHVNICQKWTVIKRWRAQRSSSWKWMASCEFVSLKFCEAHFSISVLHSMKWLIFARIGHSN